MTLTRRPIFDVNSSRLPNGKQERRDWAGPEIASVPFHVTFLGQDLGILDKEVTYAPNLEAAQANYTSLLHLRPLSDYFVRYDVTGRAITIERAADGSHSLTMPMR